MEHGASRTRPPSRDPVHGRERHPSVRECQLRRLDTGFEGRGLETSSLPCHADADNTDARKGTAQTDPRPGPSSTAQVALGHLAHRVAWECIDDLDRARNLDRRQPGGAAPVA